MTFSLRYCGILGLSEEYTSRRVSGRAKNKLKKERTNIETSQTKKERTNTKTLLTALSRCASKNRKL